MHKGGVCTGVGCARTEVYTGVGCDRGEVYTEVGCARWWGVHRGGVWIGVGVDRGGVCTGVGRAQELVWTTMVVCTDGIGVQSGVEVNVPCTLHSYTRTVIFVTISRCAVTTNDS